jgi:hypothetical protein
MTGHKTQGVTTGCAFVVVDGTTDRELAKVSMSRSRQANPLYLADAESSRAPMGAAYRSGK